MLGTWAKTGYTGRASIELGKVKFSSKDGLSTDRRSDILYMLGGRRSIVQWLRLQGGYPMIGNNTGKMALYATVARKKQLLDKDLTLVALYPDKKLQVAAYGGWKVEQPFDLRTTSEARISPHTGQAIGEFTPAQLAGIFERLFGWG